MRSPVLTGLRGAYGGPATATSPWSPAGREGLPDGFWGAVARHERWNRGRADTADRAVTPLRSSALSALSALSRFQRSRTANLQIHRGSPRAHDGTSSGRPA